MSALFRFAIGVSFAALLCGGCGHAATATLVLDAPAMTSAGIFDDRGRLVRTLWSGRSLPAGEVSLRWDGLDEEGRPVAREGRYQARLLGHHIQYEWEGVIGNTSRAEPGRQIHRAFGLINDMAFDAAGHGFYVVGFNERQHALHRIDAGLVQEPRPVGPVDFRRVLRYVATDGELVYAANIGLAAAKDSPFRGAESFVVAFRVVDGSEYGFPEGRRGEGEFKWASAADFERQELERDGAFPNAPSGLAVQRRGGLLFVSHAGLDEVRLFDKRSGRRVGQVAVKTPRDIAAAPDGSFWVLCQEDGHSAVAHFRQRGAVWERLGSISGEALKPVALGVSPVDGTVLVADASSEQLRAYDDGGQPIWTFGRSGGYRQGGPEVTHDRLGFSDGPAYVAFQADGSFWVADPVNQRNLHLSRDCRYIEQIQYLPHSYVSTVDGANPNRVFNGFLEFEVDYSLPLRQSWKLVRNWFAGLDGRYRPDFISGLRAVVTLPDGRTYATVFRNDGAGDELVELTADGLRPLGLRLRLDERLYPDGMLRSHVIRLALLRVFERRPGPVEASGQRGWSAPELVAEVPRLTERDPYFHEVPLVHGVNDPSYPRTASGRLVSFNPGKSSGFHLGLIGTDGEGWWWRASPTAVWRVDLDGTLLTREGGFDVGHGVQYPANVAVATGEQIVYGYHGEGWNGGQADQWIHFHESGLYLGQFGRPAYPAVNVLGPQPGTAGNAFTPSLVVVGGETYLWHNDESVHGGIHRWHLRGLDSLFWREVAISP